MPRVFLSAFISVQENTKRIHESIGNAHKNYNAVVEDIRHRGIYLCAHEDTQIDTVTGPETGTEAGTEADTEKSTVRGVEGSTYSARRCAVSVRY